VVSEWLTDGHEEVEWRWRTDNSFEAAGAGADEELEW